jgi:hypothetical protein
VENGDVPLGKEKVLELSQMGPVLGLPRLTLFVISVAMPAKMAQKTQQKDRRISTWSEIAMRKHAAEITICDIHLNMRVVTDVGFITVVELLT